MPIPMDRLSRAQFLWLKYGWKSRPMDMAACHGYVLNEKRAAEAGKIRVTPGLLTELRSECQEIAILAKQAAE